MINSCAMLYRGIIEEEEDNAMIHFPWFSIKKRLNNYRKSINKIETKSQA